MANPRYNKQVAEPRGMKVGGRVKKKGGGMSTRRRDMADGYYKDDMGMKGGPMMKKGGRVKKKKQGYKDRKDESIAMRIKKKIPEVRPTCESHTDDKRRKGLCCQTKTSSR